MGSLKNPGRAERTLWTPTRLLLTALFLILVAAFALSSCNSTDGAAGAGKAPAPRNPAAGNVPAAPPALASLPQNVRDAELVAVSGDPIKLSDYSGKVVLVNLWATWCAPCRIEIPELVKLHKEFQAQGVEMVGLSPENPDT